MKFLIKNIILYPKNKTHAPKILKFENKKINIFTGYSQKGKSAIIDIIDYCLASEECNIPVGKIRDSVDVYAIYIKYNDEYLFIGRSSYEDSKSEMYFYRESNKGKEKSLRTNEWLNEREVFKHNRKTIISILNQMSGFQNTSLKPDMKGFSSTASFRDIISLLFQTQNIIANPNTLFYKTDSWEHLLKLKTFSDV